MIYFLSPVWISLFVIDAVIAAAVYFICKDKDTEKVRKVLFRISIAGLVYWFIYKILLFSDRTFDFRIWKEFPLQLCNLNTILLVFALSKKGRDTLLNFCYCFGILGAFMALATPDPEFVNISIFNPAKGLGYWGTHHYLLVMCLCIVTSGVYVPKYKDLLKSTPLLMAFYFAMHFVNLWFSKIAGYQVNYFFTLGMDDNPVVDILYGIIPNYPLYIMPAIVLVVAVSLLFVFLGRLVNRKRIAER